MAEDCTSSPSSCAISLCEPEGNQSLESCSVSNVSTRPSSTLSTAKKAHTWHRRLSVGLKSPAESYCEQVGYEVKPTVTSVSYVNTPPIVTKHYSSHSVYKPSSDSTAPVLPFHDKSATLPHNFSAMQENSEGKLAFSRSWFTLK